MEKTPLFKNLRLMDNRVKDNKNKGLEMAGIKISYLHEAEELTRALIARNAYDEVHMEWFWEQDRQDNFYIVTVFWNNEGEK